MSPYSQEDRRDGEIGLEQVKQSLVERYASRAEAGLPVFAEDETDVAPLLSETEVVDSTAVLTV